jgi:lysophospholipase L1-like esterase
MAEMAIKRQIPIFFITPPHGFAPGRIPKKYLIENLMVRDDSLIPLHESYIDATRKVAEENHVFLLDLARFFMETNRGKLMELDGIHPNSAGHRIIAQEIAKAIRDQGR